MRFSNARDGVLVSRLRGWVASPNLGRRQGRVSRTRQSVPALISQCCEPPKSDETSGSNSFLFRAGDNVCRGTRRPVTTSLRLRVRLPLCSPRLQLPPQATSSASYCLHVLSTIPHNHTLHTHIRPLHHHTRRPTSHRHLQTWRCATVRPWSLAVPPPCCSPAGGFTASLPRCN